jgi:hypothetical protein
MAREGYIIVVEDLFGKCLELRDGDGEFCLELEWWGHTDMNVYVTQCNLICVVGIFD